METISRGTSLSKALFCAVSKPVSLQDDFEQGTLTPLLGLATLEDRSNVIARTKPSDG